MKIELTDNSILIDNKFIRVHKLELLGEKVFAVVEGGRVNYYDKIADALNYVNMRISGHSDAPVELVVEILSKMDLSK